MVMSPFSPHAHTHTHTHAHKHTPDLETLQKEAESAARLGYTGKQVIHPSQVPVVQAAFSPGQRQVDWARGLIQAFQQHQESGKVGKW